MSGRVATLKQYFCLKRYFWKRNGYSTGVTSRPVKSIWPQINSIDAAYEYKKRNIAYFFEGTTLQYVGHCLCVVTHKYTEILIFFQPCHSLGDHYWGIRGNTVLPGYPKSLSNFGFPSSVKKIDAAVHVSYTGKTLLFVDSRYWRLVIIEGNFAENQGILS